MSYISGVSAILVFILKEDPIANLWLHFVSLGLVLSRVILPSVYYEIQDHRSDRSSSRKAVFSVHPHQNAMIIVWVQILKDVPHTLAAKPISVYNPAFLVLYVCIC